MDWYKKAFSDTYLEVYRHRDEAEALAAAEVIRRAISPLMAGEPDTGRKSLDILDLCCGQARYSALLTGQGHNVVGLDLSRQLLEEAALRNSGQKEGTTPSLVRGDMRSLPFRACAFDLAINMFTSFGYFHRDEDNRAVLEGMGRALRRGGCFLIDYLNREKLLGRLVPEDKYERGGLLIEQSRRISRDSLRVEKNVLVRRPDGTEERYTESVRMYSRGEMEQMLDGAGLEVIEVFGDYDCSVFDAESPRLILTGRRNG